MNNLENDNKIMELRRQITEKKSLISKDKRMAPVTNCYIELDGVKTNIQTLNKNQLLLMAVKLNSYIMSAKNLEIDERIMISGYSIEDWAEDIRSLVLNINAKVEATNLSAMESRLSKLLSDGKKTELEIGEIEYALGLDKSKK